jgi:hypothetical protein
VLQFTPVPLVAPEVPGGVDSEIGIGLSKFIMFRMSPNSGLRSPPVDSLGPPADDEDIIIAGRGGGIDLSGSNVDFVDSAVELLRFDASGRFVCFGDGVAGVGTELDVPAELLDLVDATVGFLRLDGSERLAWSDVGKTGVGAAAPPGLDGGIEPLRLVDSVGDEFSRLGCSEDGDTGDTKDC